MNNMNNQQVSRGALRVLLQTNEECGAFIAQVIEIKEKEHTVLKISDTEVQMHAVLKNSAPGLSENCLLKVNKYLFKQRKIMVIKAFEMIAGRPTRMGDPMSIPQSSKLPLLSSDEIEQRKKTCFQKQVQPYKPPFENQKTPFQTYQQKRPQGYQPQPQRKPMQQQPTMPQRMHNNHHHQITTPQKQNQPQYPQQHMEKKESMNGGRSFNHQPFNHHQQPQPVQNQQQQPVYHQQQMVKKEPANGQQYGQSSYDHQQPYQEQNNENAPQNYQQQSYGRNEPKNVVILNNYNSSRGESTSYPNKDQQVKTTTPTTISTDLDDLYEPKIPAHYTQVAGRQPVPLEMIDPYMNSWVTCVRIVDRFPIREFHRKDGTPGKLLTVELKDLRGYEMVATMFSEAVDKFEKILEINKTFYISKAKVNKARNLKYTRIKSPFQMVIRPNSIVLPCEDNGNISKGAEAKTINHFVDIQNLQDKDEVTLTGVVKHASDLFTITTGKGSDNERQMKKRDLFLIDLYQDQPYLIKVNLWEAQSKLRAKAGDIVKVTNLRVGTYNDSKSLTASRKTDIIAENPSDIRFTQLNAWFKQNPELSHEHMTCICDVGDKPFRKARGLPHLLRHITEFGLGADAEKSDFITVKAYVQPIELNFPIYYPCCNTCGKKVRQQGENSPFECANCNFVVEDPGYKYMIRMTLCDSSGEVQATAFDKVCVSTFFQISASEMKSLSESQDAEDVAEAETYVRGLSLSQFEFTLAVSRRRDDETQQSINVIRALPINFYVDAIRKQYRSLLHALTNYDPDDASFSSSSSTKPQAPFTSSEIPSYPNNNYLSQYNPTPTNATSGAPSDSYAAAPPYQNQEQQHEHQPAPPQHQYPPTSAGGPNRTNHFAHHQYHQNVSMHAE